MAMDERETLEVQVTPGSTAGSRLHIWARTVLGKVRAENQDAWCVATSEGVWTGPRGPQRAAPGIDQGRLVMGVFDGLGGHANGREAAQAAAKALPDVMAPGVPVGVAVARLEEVVFPTGGMTTALIASIERGADQVRVLSVGDSAAFTMGEGGRLRRVNKLDRSTRHALDDCLGTHAQREGTVGHEVRLPLGDGLVLTTDGVADVVPFEQEWGGLLRDPVPRVGKRFHGLFEAVLQRGAPDNATTILVRSSRGF